jgi:protein-tyrosine phosphatase
MLDQPVRVLAVCMGNICRSPTAEAAIRQAAEAHGVAVEVDSAGTGAWHAGEPPDPRMSEAARGMGLTLTGKARQVRPSDFDEFDLIVAMDHRNHGELMAMAPDEVAAAKVRLFRSFDPEAADLEVPDPYYGGDQGFRDVVTMVQAAADGLVRSLGADRP